jgi:hypothetical protein
MFRALLAYPQKSLHKRHLVYCVRVMSDGCTILVPDGTHCSNKAVNGSVEGGLCQSSYSECVSFKSHPEMVILIALSSFLSASLHKCSNKYFKLSSECFIPHPLTPNNL